MAPTELQELNVQLKDLLGKAFIHPSVSPWGALEEPLPLPQIDDLFVHLQCFVVFSKINLRFDYQLRIKAADIPKNDLLDLVLSLQVLGDTF